MAVLIWGVGPFLAILTLHVIAWRIRVPRAGRRRLFQLFLGFLPLVLGLMLAGDHFFPTLSGLLPGSPARSALAAVLYLSCALAYLALYVALEGDSPTLSLTRLMDGSEPAGVTRAALEERIGLGRHILSRLDLMVVDGMVDLHGGRYHIAPKGRRLLAWYDAYDRLAALGHEKTV